MSKKAKLVKIGWCVEFIVNESEKANNKNTPVCCMRRIA
jgi:hypothetical protein